MTDRSPAGGLPRRVLVLGGARSGKSTYAERLLADRTDVTYVATGGEDPADPEWAQRIARHRARRPPAWTTLETADLEPLVRAGGPPLLVDCLTLWLSRTMDALDVWTAPDRGGLRGVEDRIASLVDAWAGARRTIVAVSNEVGSGIVPATASGRLYRDLLGRLNAEIAAVCEDVVLCVAGRTLHL